MPMKRMQYKKVPTSNRDYCIQQLETGESQAIVEALLSLAFHDPDWQFVQELLIKYSRSSIPDVRYMAILCFGHITRIHGKLDKERVMPILKAALEDPDWRIRGTSEDVLEDIEIFYGRGQE